MENQTQPAVSAATPGQADEPEIPVHLVQLWLCDLCLDGEGDECHTPGCSLWIHDVPKPALRGLMGVTILGPALEPFMTPEQAAAQEPKPAPGFAAWLAAQGDALGDGTYTAADMAAAYGMGQAEPLTVKPADDVKAAPELAAAMRETRLMRERLDAIRELCKNRIRVAGADGKGIARQVIAIIDKLEGK